MKNTIRLTLFVLFSFISLFSYAQTELDCSKGATLYKVVETNHISKFALDDSLSERIFDNFITSLDPTKLVFTTEDIASFQIDKFNLDDDIRNSSCESFMRITDRYIANVDRLNEIISSIKPEDINIQESVEFDFSPETHYPESENEANWKKVMKMRILMDIVDKNPEVTSSELNNRLVKKTLEEIVNVQLCKVKPDNAERLQDIYNLFLKSISHSFDPHTEYFDENQKQDFISQLQNETLSFGFIVEENDMGSYVIANIIPGGAAWKSNKIEEKDRLIGVADKNGKMQKVDCNNIRKISTLLNSQNTTEVVFLISKKNGSKVKVQLSKGMEVTDGNLLKSYVLTGKNKIGYISLPSFYGEMEEYAQLSNGCTNDVAKEILRLEQEGIDGLIIDLRFNGGGSMLEAIGMSGLFINYGPVGIEKTKGLDPVVLKDMNRGMAYRGPLTLIVNSQSASASEFFASAMQDYNRATIVGTPTFGKGTMQVIMPMSESLYGLAPVDVRDFLKTTVGRYYRITGKGVQSEGVTPDIIVPDVYNSDMFREKSNPAALQANVIDKKTYYKAHDELPIDELIELSNSRRAAFSKYEETEQLLDQLIKRSKDSKIQLNLNSLKKLKQEMDQPMNVGKLNHTVKITIPRHKQHILGQSQAEKDITIEDIKNINTDLQLLESIYITTDLISLTNK